MYYTDGHKTLHSSFGGLISHGGHEMAKTLFKMAAVRHLDCKALKVFGH